jgi:hypothetical protein
LQDKRDAAVDNGYRLSLQAGFLTRETWELQATGYYQHLIDTQTKNDSYSASGQYLKIPSS